jgi:hypothetical protein
VVVTVMISKASMRIPGMTGSSASAGAGRISRVTVSLIMPKSDAVPGIGDALGKGCGDGTGLAVGSGDGVGEALGAADGLGVTVTVTVGTG